MIDPFLAAMMKVLSQLHNDQCHFYLISRHVRLRLKKAFIGFG